MTKTMFFKATLGMGCGSLERKMPRPAAHGFCGTGVGAVNS